MESLKATDQAAQAVAVAPRVRLADIEGAIAERHDFTAAEAVQAMRITMGGVADAVLPANSPLDLLSICILVMRNGFTVIGKSAPASAANFDAELGKKFAYEDAVRQLWPLTGFSLRDTLARQEAFDREPKTGN